MEAIDSVPKIAMHLKVICSLDSHVSRLDCILFPECPIVPPPPPLVATLCHESLCMDPEELGSKILMYHRLHLSCQV